MASGCLTVLLRILPFSSFGFSLFFGVGFLLPGMVLASRQLQGQASLRKWKNSSEGNGARSLAGKLCDTRAMDSFQGLVPPVICFKSKGMYEAKTSEISISCAICLCWLIWASQARGMQKDSGCSMCVN